MNKVIEINLNEIREAVNVVYGLVNEVDKRVYISHGVSLISSLSRIMSEINSPKFRQLSEDLNHVKITLYEIGTVDKKLREVKARHILDSYIERGYSEYTNTNLVQYRFLKDIIMIKTLNYIRLQLVNKNKDKILLGLFRKEIEYQRYMNSHYPDGKINDIIMSTNSYTQKFKDKV